MPCVMCVYAYVYTCVCLCVRVLVSYGLVMVLLVQYDLTSFVFTHSLCTQQHTHVYIQEHNHTHTNTHTHTQSHTQAHQESRDWHGSIFRQQPLFFWTLGWIHVGTGRSQSCVRTPRNTEVLGDLACVFILAQTRCLELTTDNLLTGTKP